MEPLILCITLACFTVLIIFKVFLFEYAWKQKSYLQRLYAFLRLRSLKPYTLYRCIRERHYRNYSSGIQFFYYTETKFVLFIGPDRHNSESTFYKPRSDDSQKKNFEQFEISLKEQSVFKAQKGNQLSKYFSKQFHDLITVKEYIKKKIPKLFLLEEEETPISYITSPVPTFRSFIKGFIARKKKHEHPEKED